MKESILSIAGALASFIGTYITYRQYKKTKEAKEAVEVYREEIIRNQQIIELPEFSKEINRFLILLQNSQKTSNSQGKDKNYLNLELEKFLTKLNRIIGILNKSSKDRINTHYEKLNIYRSKIQYDDNDLILKLLSDVRNLERTIAEIHQDNALK